MTRSRSALFLVYSNGIVGRVVKYDLASKKSSDIPLPASGDAQRTCPDAKSNHCLLTIEGWITPRTLFDLDGDKSVASKSAFSSDVVYPGYDQLATEEVELKGARRDDDPALDRPQEGDADGREQQLHPRRVRRLWHQQHPRGSPSRARSRSMASFSPLRTCAAGARREKRGTWPGKKTTKPNTWKDFISSAEYLIAKGYTSKEPSRGRLASAGGILIGRAITERPDLFAAAVCNVGVANAAPEFSPNGPVNTPEFGTVAIQEEAAALYEMDALQHVQAGTKYPGAARVGGLERSPGRAVAAREVHRCAAGFEHARASPCSSR